MYWRNPEHGLGTVINEAATGDITVFFPRTGETKKFRPAGMKQPAFVQPSAEAIRELNAEFRARLPRRLQGGRVPSSRSTHCYVCKKPIDSKSDIECAHCGWIVCPRDGACGCGFGMGGP